MNEDEIRRALLPRIGEYFNGTYPKDVLPRSKDNGIYILNTDLSLQKGSHWIALHVDDGIVYIFDSLALPLYDDYYVTRFIKNFKKTISVSNNLRIQSLYSDVCGLYCCVFALCVFGKMEFKQFVQMFKPTCFEDNDKSIVEMYKILFYK